MHEKKIFLEKYCKIIKWTTNENHVNAIFNDFRNSIANGRTLKISICQGIISKHCPGTVFELLEGVDNSDLNTLIILAMKK